MRVPESSQKQNKPPKILKSAVEGSGTEETGESATPKSSIRQLTEDELLPVPLDP